MICFNHRNAHAVGLCRNCFRGVCGVCAREVDPGLACSAACAEALAPAAGKSLGGQSVGARFAAFAAPRLPADIQEAPAELPERAAQPQPEPAGSARQERPARRERQHAQKHSIKSGRWLDLIMDYIKNLGVRPSEMAIYFVVAVGIAAVGALALG